MVTPLQLYMANVNAKRHVEGTARIERKVGMKGSWKTKVSGLVISAAMILGEVSDLIDADPLTVFEWPVIMAALGALGLGLSARQNNVTSEEAGAK